MADYQEAFYKEQQRKYQEVEPRRFVPEAVKGTYGPQIVKNTMDILSSYDPYLQKTVQPLSGQGLATLLQGQAQTTEQEKKCRNYIGLQGLRDAIRDQQAQPNAPIRCGWRYKPSPGFVPEVAQGALGTRNGPLNTSASEDAIGKGVEWIWSLEDAERRMLQDAAAVSPSGETLGWIDGIAGGAYKNAFGYCKPSRKLIPITENKTARYPRSTTMNCPPSEIVTRVQDLPRESSNPLRSLQTAATSGLAACIDKGRNPSLNRDCLLRAIQNSGCSSEGTLYQALQQSRPTATSYDRFLQSQPSFQAYQSRQGDAAITNRLFQANTATWEDAVQQITNLQRASLLSSDARTRIAAKDLCTNAGLFETYDFCGDIPDSTNISIVELPCLQKFWQDQSGKPSGLLYPRTKELSSLLGTIQTYGDFKVAVQQLKARTQDSNPVSQRKALDDFFGVVVSTAPFAPNNLGSSDLTVYDPSDLVLWLDATDGASLLVDGNNGVKQWNDKSKAKRNVSQPWNTYRPQYVRTGGMPGIRFDGVDDFLDIPDAYATVRNEFTIFVVEKRGTDKLNTFFLGGMDTQTNRNLHVGYRSSALATFAFWGNDLNVSVPSFAQTSELPRLWTIQKGTGKRIFINGSFIQADSRPDSLLSWNGATIGRTFVHFYQGTVYEICFFNKALDDTTIQKIEGYLAHKWGIASFLPKLHPHSTSAP
jgi:hypothetical protein